MKVTIEDSYFGNWRTLAQYASAEEALAALKNWNLAIGAIRVMADGKEIFNSDPRMASKSCAATTKTTKNPKDSCRRCNGTGQYGTFGVCFECKGCGRR